MADEQLPKKPVISIVIKFEPFTITRVGAWPWEDVTIEMLWGPRVVPHPVTVRSKL